MGCGATQGALALWLAAAGVLLYGTPVHSAVQDGGAAARTPDVATLRLVQQRQQQQQPPPIACPGIGGGVCSLSCQRATCEALAAFFRSTYNVSAPWQHPATWEITRTTSCDRIVPRSTAGQLPPYCGWYGITCCKPADVAEGRCHVIDGLANLTLTADSLNGSYSDPELMDSLEQLHACGMVGLNLESNDMSSELSPRWGRFTNLTVLNLANGWVSGTLPPELADLTRLKVLDIGTNFLHGTIGPWIGRLSQLEVLSLGANAGVNDPDPETGEERTGFIGPIPSSITNLTRLVELDLQLNSLTGTIPAALCDPDSRLLVLNLRSNRLTGPAASVTRCHQLATLDLGFNAFTGSIPASKEWTTMVSLMLGHNSFTGELPNELYKMPIVTYLDVSDNSLVGQLDDRISLLISLNDLDVSNNQLSGAIGRGIFYIPQLARLNLANNNLSSTINPSLGLAFNLRELILVNNSGLVGRLPDEAAGLSYLHRVGLLGTNMSCEPAEVALAEIQALKLGKPPPPVYRCPDDALLPCFLEFESYDIPRGDSSHMRCRPIKHRLPEFESKSCPVAALIAAPDPSDDVLAAQWDLPPSYYQYQGCHCLDGYKAIWSREGTRLECVEDHWAALPPWTWVLIALGAVLALLAASLLLLGRRLVLLRSRWNREMELRRKRKQGLPQDGEFVSVVVTDVEGYSCLMKASPRLATKALAMHNAVLRKAAHDHAGILVEQEGDSWAVAFHEAQDAVAFCMQAQQALHKVDWRLGLVGRRGDAELMATDSVTSTVSTDVPSASSRLRQLLGVGSLGLISRWSSTDGGSTGPPPLWQVNRVEMLERAGPSFSARAAGGKPEGSANSNEDASAALDEESAQGAPSASSSRSGSSPSMMQLREGSEKSRQLGDGDAAAASAAGVRPSSQGPFSRTSSRRGLGRNQSVSEAQRVFLSTLMRSSSGAVGDDQLFRGLRVRMGVACGVMPAGVDICSSGVFDLAKVISDMANGGQVLIGSATFDLVKDNQMLAAVDHHGYNDKLLVGYSGLACRLRSCFRPCSKKPAEDEQAGEMESSSLVFLDMGEFDVPGLDTAAARGQKPAPSGSSITEGSGNGASKAAGPAPAAFFKRSFAPQRTVTMAGASNRGSSRHRRERLRVFSVLPPCLAERARVWGGSLSLKEGWRQTDRGFFDAPGAAAALLTPHTPGALAVSDGLPKVTMVFMVVEGAKHLVRWRRSSEVRQVSRMLLLVMRAALDAMPDGYLCRLQEGDLKYMLAFSTAASALQWCLLVQEALMYAPWPPALLEMAEFAERRAPGDGALLFRGPRLKMGVCEGRPRTLEPDHLGHADYFGASVNQAARYMDAAAHGGQVACEAALVESVFSEWRLSDTHGAGDISEGLLPPPPSSVASSKGRQSQAGSPAASSPAPRWETQDRANPGALPAPLPFSLPEGRQWPQQEAKRLSDDGGRGWLRQDGARGAQRQRQRQDVPDPEMGVVPSDLSGLALRTLSGTRISRPLMAPPRRGPPLPIRSLSSTGMRASLQGLADQYGGQWRGAQSAMRRPGAGVVASRVGFLLGALPFDGEDELPRHNITVRALHLGTFVFKGSDALDMVSVTTAALAPRQELLPHGDAKGKGMVIEERDGVADGAVVSLPDILPGLREVFVEAFGQESRISLGAAGAPSSSGYSAWLAQELSRRRLCASDTAAAPAPGSRRAQSFTTKRM